MSGEGMVNKLTMPYCLHIDFFLPLRYSLITIRVDLNLVRMLHAGHRNTVYEVISRRLKELPPPHHD
jgi:hypothetical protein